MSMQCPGCGTAIAPEAIRKASAFAVCASCGRITDLEHRFVAAASPSPSSPPRLPSPPRGVILNRAGGTVEVRIPWSRTEKKDVGISVAFLSALFLLLLFWRPGALPALIGGEAEKADKDLGFLQFLVGGLAVAFAAAWKYSAVNNTFVVAEDRVIRSWSGPLPGPPPTSVETEGAVQFHCVRVLAIKPRRGGQRLAVKLLKDDACRFSVLGTFRDGRVVEVVPRLFKAEEALFVEALLEWKYGIRNVPVEGEVGPGRRTG